MDEKSNNKIILTYREIRGIAQPIRNLLCYLEVPFQENIVQKNVGTGEDEQFFNSGFPFIQCQDEKLYDVVPIMKFLSRRQNKMELIGLTPQDQGRLNEILFKHFYENSKFLAILINGVKEIAAKPEQKEKISTQVLKKLIQQSKFIQGCLIYSKKGIQWIMGYLTLADFFFYQLCFYICNFYGTVLHLNSNYAAFEKFKNLFQKTNFYQKNQTFLQKKPIFYSINKQTDEIIEKSWINKTTNLFC